MNTILQSLGDLSGVAPTSNSDGDPEIDFDWFQNPQKNWDVDLKPDRWPALYQLINVPLRVSMDSPFDTTVTWLQIPKAGPSPQGSVSDQASGMYVALPADVPTQQSKSFAISLGLAENFNLPASTLQLFAELPMIEFPSQRGTVVRFGDPDRPLRIGIDLRSTTNTALFTLGHAYQGLRVLVSLYASTGGSVAIEVSYDGTNFSPITPTFADFEKAINSLLDGEMAGWLTAKVPNSGSYSALLQATQVLTSSNHLSDQKTLQAVTLTSFLNQLFSAMFSGAADSIQVVKSGVDSSEGVFLVRRANAAAAANHDFGLRIAMNGMPLPYVSAIDQLILQIGKDIGKGGEDWTKSKKDPGFTYRLLTSGTTPVIAPQLDLVSIGYDYMPRDPDGTLFETTNKCSLKGFNFRIYLSEAGPSPFVFGAVGKVTGLTIPLSKLAKASKPQSEGGGNPARADPVPQRILEAASDPDTDDDDVIPRTGGSDDALEDDADPPDAPPPNGQKKEEKEKKPQQKKVTFGFSAAWNAKQSFDFQLYDDKDKRTDIVWVPLGKKFGDGDKSGGPSNNDPKAKTASKYSLDISKIGLEWKNDTRTLGLVINGSLSINLVKLTVYGFGLEFPVVNPQAPTPLLSGALATLAVPSQKLELSGGLLRSSGKDGVKYIGELLFKVDTFAFTLFAGMGTTPKSAPGSTGGATAAFVFLRIDYPFGGPDAFFLNGICGGFGYNMLLDTPSISDLPQFPMIAGADAKKNPFLKDDPLEALAKFLTITPGMYWVVLGVVGTTYKICNSTILLAVQWGTDLIVEILGLSTIRLPEDTDKDAIVLTQLAMRAVYDNNLGILAIEGQLVKGSYVLSKQLEITGGFAMYFWVEHTDQGPAHIPDFVISLGGYSPYFTKPAHYPNVSRIGIKYKSSDNLSIEGGFYFAITPAAVMAGGFLKAAYTSDSKKFHAWFNAEANFLLGWKPLTYHIGVSVSVGASYTISIFGFSKTLSLTIGAGIDLWGQPFGWQATIDLYLFSITIPGDGQTAPEPPAVSWSEFRDHFLDSGSGGGSVMALARGGPIVRNTVATTPNSPFLLVKVVNGLAPTPAPDGRFLGLIRADGFIIEAGTKVPVKKVTFTAAKGPDVVMNLNTAFGVGPAAIPDDQFQSQMTVTLTREGSVYDNVALAAVQSSAPKALWQRGANPLASDTLLAGIGTGLQLTQPQFIPDRTVPIDVSALLYQQVSFPGNGTFDWHATTFPVTDTLPDDPWPKVWPTIDSTKAARDRILAVLQKRFVLPSPLTITSDYGAGLLEQPAYRLLGEVKS